MTYNSVNDIRWKFQKLDITRASIDCFVFDRSGDLLHNHYFCFLGLLKLKKREGQKES